MYKFSSHADVASVDRAGFLFVIGAFNNRAGVREDSEFVVFDEAAEQELVVLNLADGLQASGERGEINFLSRGEGSRANLDSIASAEASALAAAECFEKIVLMVGAGGAIGVAR